jgi:hypothetical protein
MNDRALGAAFAAELSASCGALQSDSALCQAIVLTGQVDKLLSEFRIASTKRSNILKPRGLLTIMRSFLIRTEHS